MIFFKSNMKLLDVCDDVLFLILNELYKLRGKRVIHQLKDEWMDRRPWFRVLLSGRRAIHEGRAFLSKNPDLKDVKLIQFESKCYIKWCSNNVNVFNYHIGHNIPESKGGTLSLNNSRLILLQALAVVIKNGMKILGVSTPKSM